METYKSLSMETQPLISVILPVRNEANALPALLTSLVRQDFPSSSFEIIVADGASTDNTRDVVRSIAAASDVTITLVDNPGIRSGPGRNAGLRAARGEYVLFIDGHCCIPSAHLLRDTVLLFTQTQAECLCRPQPLRASAQSNFGEAVAAVRGSVLGHGRDSLIYDMAVTGFVDPASSGAAYRRSIFERTGPYDQSFDACEDVELNTRVRKLGMRAYTDPRLAVFYEPRSKLSSLLKQMLRYGTGRARLMLKHPDCVSFAQLAPAFLSLWLFIALLILAARIHTPIWFTLTLFAPLALYLMLVFVASVCIAANSSIRLLYQAPAIYLGIHLGLGIGLWAEIVRRAAGLLVRTPSLKENDRMKDSDNLTDAGRQCVANATSHVKDVATRLD